jgi:hypothetical protein
MALFPKPPAKKPDPAKPNVGDVAGGRHLVRRLRRAMSPCVLKGAAVLRIGRARSPPAKSR